MAELPKTTGGGTRSMGLPESGIPWNTDEFTLSETMVGVMYTLTVDGLCALLDLFAIGLVISPVIRNGVAFSIWLWFKSKNDPHVTKVGRQVIKGFGNLIPLLPINTTMFIVEVYIHNHPEKFAVIEKVAGATSGKM